MTQVMGVLNVTPDSFSDGGLWPGTEQAVARGLELVAQGADIVDVGGESTRPGAIRPHADEESARVVPVIEALHREGITTSIDTMRGTVAAACLEAGADIVNDVSGGLADPGMAAIVAAADVPYIAMHWRGHSATMDQVSGYDDVVAEVKAHLRRRLEALVGSGIKERNIILDPGFGFAKQAHHNWTLLAALDEIVALGPRVLVGTSRKRFLATLSTAPRSSESAPAHERDAATAATSVLAAQSGAWAVRVHDVPSTVAALGVARMVGRE
ncbi:MAG: dihydropteroate synthase [Ornithinimicrobium sp.]